MASIATTDPAAAQLAVVPSHAIAYADHDSDIDDLVPGVEWLGASGKEGRFFDEDKQPIGDSLKVVMLHAAPGQTAWAPRDPERVDQVPHPLLQFFKDIGITPGRPWCKNKDVKRQAPQVSEDLTADQLTALRGQGYTGQCAGCPFKRWAPGAGPVCRETRELLLNVKGRDIPARMTVDGTSLQAIKSFLRKEFKGKAKVVDQNGKEVERWVDFLTHSRAVTLGFARENNEHGTHYVMTFEAQSGFLPENQIAEFSELRELYLQYVTEQDALGPAAAHPEASDFTVEAAEPAEEPAPQQGTFEDDPVAVAQGHF